MAETFGSTCHGAGRARSRNSARNNLDYTQVLENLKTKGIAIRVARCSARAGRGGAGQRWCACRYMTSSGGLEQDCLEQWRQRSDSWLPSLLLLCSPKLVMEEAPESYKDVSDVVDTCHEAGISRKTIKLRPIAVIKG